MQISPLMDGHAKCCNWGVIKPWSPLIKNPFNGEKVKGLPLPEFGKVEIGPQVATKLMQTWFKIMKQAVAKCPSIELKIMDESVPFTAGFWQYGQPCAARSF